MKRLILTSLFLILALTLFTNVPIANASSPPNSFSISINKDIFLKGVDNSIVVSGVTNASSKIVNLKVVNEAGSTVFETNVTSQDYSYSLNQPFGSLQAGRYSIIGTDYQAESRTWFTYVNTGDWGSVTFPLSVIWKNLNYTLFSNRTLLISNSVDWIKLTFPTLDGLTGATQTVSRNNMVFRYNLVRTGIVSLDLCFVLAHNGFKFYLKGTQNIPRTITVKVNSSQQLTRRFDSVYCGSLVFDFSDLRRSGLTFNYNSTSDNLNINAETTFFLDPSIFSDGFESGDLTSWTGTYSSGATFDVSSSYAHHGSYSGRITGLGTSSERASVYKTLGSTYSLINVRIVCRFSAEPSCSKWGAFINLYGSSDFLGKIIYDSTNNRVGVRLYTTTWTDSWGSSNSWTITSDTNYIVELECYVHATEGYLKVYIDGNLAHTFNGKTDSRGSISRVYIGDVYLDSDESSGITEYIDCVVVNSTYIGTEGTSYPVSTSLTLTLSKSVAVAWSSTVAVSKSLTGAFTVGVQWSANVGLSQAITGAYDGAVQWSANAGLSKAFSFASSVVAERFGGTLHEVGVSLSMTYSSVVSVASVFGVGTSQSFTILNSVVSTLGGTLYEVGASLSLTLSIVVSAVLYEHQYATRGMLVGGVCLVILLLGGVVVFFMGRR